MLRIERHAGSLLRRHPAVQRVLHRLRVVALACDARRAGASHADRSVAPHDRLARLCRRSFQRAGRIERWRRAATALLHHMRQLMRDQPLAVRRVRGKVSTAECDIRPNRERVGEHRLRRVGAARAVMDAHRGKIVAEALLHLLTQRRRQRRAFRGQQIVDRAIARCLLQGCDRGVCRLAALRMGRSRRPDLAQGLRRPVGPRLALVRLRGHVPPPCARIGAISSGFNGRPSFSYSRSTARTTWRMPTALPSAAA